MKKIRFTLISLFLLISHSFYLQAEIIEVDVEKLPVILKPDSRDLIFKQFQEDAQYNAKIFPDIQSFDRNGNEKTLIPTFYILDVPENMDFLWLSSRLSPVFKDTISTLNRLSSADAPVAGKSILICSFSGLFIPERPVSAWEHLIYKKYIDSPDLQKSRIFLINGEKFYFLERERFDSTTAFFFLDTTMKSPLQNSILTSSFGYRISPVSGKWKFHSGVDLASPEGSDVYACKAGVVTTPASDSIFGNYIIILHYNNMTSVYAHLSKSLVKKGDKVNTGSLIGKVGSTGASTGPHLHFELRKDGKPEDPGKIIK